MENTSFFASLRMTKLRKMMRDSPDAVPLRTNLKPEKTAKIRQRISPALTFFFRAYRLPETYAIGCIVYFELFVIGTGFPVGIEGLLGDPGFVESATVGDHI